MGKVYYACTTHPLGEAPTPLRYTVMFIRYGGQWLFVRHKERDTWECAGGHIEEGESPIECARRESYEEAGVMESTITELFDYWAHSTTGNASGRVFLVEAKTLAEIPAEHEMAERTLVDMPPDKLTYELIFTTLYPEVQARLEGKL